MRIAQGPYFGARFSLYPMTDRFVPVVLARHRGAAGERLEVETDDVSTFLGGHPDAVFGALERAFSRAASGGTHVVMTVLFSRGCPGETVCDPALGAVPAGPAPGRRPARPRWRAGAARRLPVVALPPGHPRLHGRDLPGDQAHQGVLTSSRAGSISCPASTATWTPCCARSAARSGPPPTPPGTSSPTSHSANSPSAAGRSSAGGQRPAEAGEGVG